MSLLSRFTVDSWRSIDRDWQQELPAEGFDWRPLIVLVTVSVALTLDYYYGLGGYVQFFRERARSPSWGLENHAFTTACRFASFVLLPSLAIALMPGERIGDYLSLIHI